MKNLMNLKNAKILSKREQKFLFLLLIIIITISCSKNIPTDITVKINNKHGNLFMRNNIPFQFIDPVPMNLKGIAKLDTFSIQYLSFYRRKKLKKLKTERLNTNNLNKKFITGIYALSGFKNNKQVLIVDANQNLDFSDDSVLSFTKDLGINLPKNIKMRHDSFPIIPVIYNSVEGQKIIKRKAYIRPFPYIDYFTYKNPTVKTKLKSELQIVAEDNNYNYGEFSVKNEKYKVAFKKNLNQYRFIFQVMNKKFLKIKDVSRRNYRLKDTVSFLKVFYRIESVNFNESKLFLKKLNIHTKIFGYQIGETISGFKLNDIRSGDSLTLNKLLADKKYVLLDFWGTWCAPCKELTPDLVQFKTQHQTDVNVLSIAFQKDENSLLKYIDEHKMDWNHALIKGYAKSQSEKPNLIKNLAIESYPTFILIDKNKKIIFRGTGKTAFMKIKRILKNKPSTIYK